MADSRAASAALTLTIIEMILRYGPTAVQIIADALAEKTEEPTPEYIRTLFIDKDPEEYFK